MRCFASLECSNSSGRGGNEAERDAIPCLGASGRAAIPIQKSKVHYIVTDHHHGYQRRRCYQGKQDPFCPLSVDGDSRCQKCDREH